MSSDKSGAPKSHLSFLDRVQHRMKKHWPIGSALYSNLEPLSHRRDIASLSLFYGHYLHVGWYSDGLHSPHIDVSKLCCFSLHSSSQLSASFLCPSSSYSRTVSRSSNFLVRTGKINGTVFLPFAFQIGVTCQP